MGLATDKSSKTLSNRLGFKHVRYESHVSSVVNDQSFYIYYITKL